jgi:hypothetical protein
MNSIQRLRLPSGDALAALFASLLQHLMTGQIRLPGFGKALSNE